MLAPLAALALWSCGDRTSGAPPVPPPSADVIARVNGVELRRTDAELLLRQHDRNAPNSTPVGEIPQAVIDTLVRDELRAQEAIAQGLDRDPKYQAALREKEAVFAAWRRETLGDRLIAQHTARNGEITDEEARAYFRDHATELATETHVLQILMRNRRAIDAVDAALRSGRAFDDVAAEHFAVPPTSTKRPWDLGYLKWAQLPEPWKPAIESIPVGGTSGVIEGGGRFWILHVVDRRTDPSIDFDRARADVMHAIEVDRQATAVSKLDHELRGRAQVERIE